MEDINLNILVVIPARGNSKGIPRKNLRSLNGKPLIWYCIQTCLRSRWKPDVCVSSDDEEIKNIARKSGASIIDRSPRLAEDATTLDPVIFDAYLQASQKKGKTYDLIITVQPTSPLLKTKSLDEAIRRMKANPDLDTIISATEDTHLSWLHKDGKFIPNYTERLNRQELTPEYRETGGFLICRSSVISKSGRIGTNVDLFVLDGPEAIDIDTFEDWSLCHYYLQRKKILFVVTAYPKIGMGHVYRALNIANEILDHEVNFLFDSKSQLGRDIVKQKHYPAFIQTHENIIEDIRQLNPDVVLNDILDTSSEYMDALNEFVKVVINFEDLGPGSLKSKATINAMYQDPGNADDPRHFGYKYSVLRNEFLMSPTKTISEEVSRVLITFGGTDPNNFTKKVLDTISDFCAKQKIKITIVLGMGYQHTIPDAGPHVTIHKKVSNMSEIMMECDLAFSSAGRTTLELAALGIPTIVMCQNKREQTHLFPTERNGFDNLGLGKDLTVDILFQAFQKALRYEWRKESNSKMIELDLTNGKSRVLKLIYDRIRSI